MQEKQPPPEEPKKAEPPIEQQMKESKPAEEKAPSTPKKETAAKPPPPAAPAPTLGSREERRVFGTVLAKADSFLGQNEPNAFTNRRAFERVTEYRGVAHYFQRSRHV